MGKLLHGKNTRAAIVAQSFIPTYIHTYKTCRKFRLSVRLPHHALADELDHHSEAVAGGMVSCGQAIIVL